jgi:hypothetical protein
MKEKDWQSSELISEYWAVQPDESLRVPTDGIEPSVQAHWYSYKLGSMAIGNMISWQPDAEEYWGTQR